MSQHVKGPTVVITPREGWQLPDWRDLREFRELLFFLAWRDVKVRYKQTVLGAAWAILQPLLAMVIFTVFFGRLAKVPSDGMPYPLFVYAALVPWTLFANAVSTGGQSLVGNANLISKVYFPRVLVPASSVGVALLDFCIASLIIAGMMVYYHVAASLTLLLVPLLVALTALAALGVGILLAALTVSYRDFRYVLPFLIQIWMFATPVVYPASLVPERWRWALAVNPMAGIIEAFRAALTGRPIAWDTLGVSALVATTVFIFGMMYFHRVERRFVDVI